MTISYNTRYLVVVGGILIQLCLGIIYAWSVFTVPLSKPLIEGGPGFSSSQTAWIFSIGLFTFSIVMVLAGRLMKFVSGRLLTIIGGALLGLGYLLAGASGGSFTELLITIGIIGGAGIGLAYAIPLKICVEWFPDKVGLVSGLAVAGFGFGATFWIKAAGSWFGGGFLSTLSIAGLPGLESTFILYGLILMGTVIIGSLVMISPPDGYKPAGWNPATDAVDPRFEGISLRGMDMLRTPQYRILFSMFLLSAFSGLMVIYSIKYFGIDSLSGTATGLPIDKASAIAGTAMAVYAIMNGLGRIAYGRLSDTLGRKKTLRSMMLFQALMMASFFWLGQSSFGLIIGASIIGFNFGGNFALFPAATAVYFGKKNVGENYGWVFLAYGFAGILGPLMAGVVRDSAGASEGTNFWLFPFITAALACLVAMALSFRLTIPSK